MNSEFNLLNLHPQLVQAVEERGYMIPTPIQAAVIPIMLAGKDVIGQAQTGTGKTAAFALPILQNLETGNRLPQCLVLAPTRELALQVSEAMQEYGAHTGVRVLSVYGGTPYNRQISALKQGVDIVVGTPGRLLDLIRKGALKLHGVKTVVLDEADEMLSMGFIEDIEAILSETPTKRQTSLFSATMPPEIRRLSARYMIEPEAVSIKRKALTVEATEQRYYLVNSSDKLAALTRLFEMEEISSALIFTRTRAGTGELANALVARGFQAETLNGDLSQDIREQVLNRFRNNQSKVLVATDVAARGLDIDDISHVINYDLPEYEEIYVHRIGRTGRAGKTGIAISLVTPREQGRLRRIESYAKVQIKRATLPSEADILQQRDDRLLRQVSIWLQRGRYRRERELIDGLVQEGFDPLEIAAAALKVARAEEKQRPIASVSEVVEIRSRREGREQRKNGKRNGGAVRNFSPRSSGSSSRSSHEEGMVRLALSQGRSHGIRVNDVVSSIAYYGGIPGSAIGKILIEPKQTYVDVPEEMVAQVLAGEEKYRIRNKPATLEIAD